ncbi:hypothetical protein AYO44_01670 [Planctomycetaceae bacterium SCGC AG-212-F19]|nr:hypothetical protein AYO44_01670 [Planctomycetaceae bacterium SCGC AG-212-F19]
MTTPTQSQVRRANRRSAIRHPPRSDIRIEVRKGVMGLGPNLLHSALDLSQTGLCAVVKTPMKRGDDAEVLVAGCGGNAIKRAAEVAWAVQREDGIYLVGFRFRPELSYTEMQQLTKM